ncbi:MAG: ParB/RepB/Spo0J family partition protein, partial [Rhodocyclaceae bacterium]
MATYEDRIAALEEDLADAKRTDIPIELIAPNPWQPRTFFDPNEIADLAASIAEVGLVQPIIVRRVQPLDTESSDKSVQSLDTSYQLIAGERRLRAHKELGRPTIKAIVTKAADDEMAMMALAENLDRADLAEYEISKAIRRAEKEFPNRKHMA